MVKEIKDKIEEKKNEKKSSQERARVGSVKKERQRFPIENDGNEKHKREKIKWR